MEKPPPIFRYFMLFINQTRRVDDGLSFTLSVNTSKIYYQNGNYSHFINRTP
jgi:hypothetical protein